MHCENLYGISKFFRRNMYGISFFFVDYVWNLKIFAILICWIVPYIFLKLIELSLLKQYKVSLPQSIFL